MLHIHVHINEIYIFFPERYIKIGIFSSLCCLAHFVRAHGSRDRMFVTGTANDSKAVGGRTAFYLSDRLS